MMSPHLIQALHLATRADQLRDEADRERRARATHSPRRRWGLPRRTSGKTTTHRRPVLRGLESRGPEPSAPSVRSLPSLRGYPYSAPGR